jgi:hypothetical protein
VAQGRWLCAERPRESKLSEPPSHLRRRGRLGVLALLGNCGPNEKADLDA